MDDQVVADQDGSVPLSRLRRRPSALWPLPGHDLQVKDVNVIEVVLAVPAAEHVHLGAAHDVGGVIVAAWRSSGAARTLIPRHRDRVQRVEVLEGQMLATLAAEYNDS